MAVLLGRDFALHSHLVLNFRERSYWIEVGADAPQPNWPDLNLPHDHDPTPFNLGQPDKDEFIVVVEDSLEQLLGDLMFLP